MRTMTNLLIVAGTALLLLAGCGGTQKISVNPEAAAKGKALVMDRRKGNCMSCHLIDNVTLPGNIGPPLVGMQERFPDKDVLHAQIYDSTKKNPQSMMPPFGRHGILTDEEIDLVVEYLYTL